MNEERRGKFVTVLIFVLFNYSRASDKRRGIAAEKAEAQKRLLTQPKRSEYAMSLRAV